MTHYTVGGTRITDVGSKKRKQYSEGRVCKKRDCITVLSIYNKHGLCYAHQPFKRPRLRGRMPSEVMEDPPKIYRCQTCSQRNRYHREVLGTEIPEVIIDGKIHREGSRGRATQCEEQ